jgi:hypothetical protein
VKQCATRARAEAVLAQDRDEALVRVALVKESGHAAARTASSSCAANARSWSSCGEKLR